MTFVKDHLSTFLFGCLQFTVISESKSLGVLIDLVRSRFYNVLLISIE